MKIKKLDARGFSHHFVMALVVLICAIGGTYYLVASHADSTASELSLSPANQTVTVGTNMVVAVDMNTAGNPIGRIQSVLTYSATNFKLVNIVPGVASNFSSNPLTSGSVQLTENPSTPANGTNVTVATITLQAIAAGPSSISLSGICPDGNYYGSTCSAIYGPTTTIPTDNELSNVTGGNYTVAPVDNVPAAPATLSAQVVSSTQINLNWPASTGATGYAVYRDGNEIATTPNTYYNDTGLTPSTTYTYYVIAYNSVGTKGQQSPPSSSLRMTTAPAPTSSSSGEQLSIPPARRPVQYVHLCASDSTYYVTQGAVTCWAGGSFIENYPSSVPGTYYDLPCVSSSTSPTATRFAYISSNESCPAGTTRVPSTLASGEQLSIPPARRPAQYLHVCTSSVSSIYVTLESSSTACTFGGNFVQNYPSSVPGTVQNMACAAISGSTMRYAYIQSGESCPSGTFTTL